MQGNRILFGHISPWFHLQAVLDHLWCAGAATRVLTVTWKAQEAGQCESWCAQECAMSPRVLMRTDETMASRHPPKGYAPSALLNSYTTPGKGERDPELTDYISPHLGRTGYQKRNSEEVHTEKED